MSSLSFDEPLPLAGLSPESFERFCLFLLAALYPDGEAHAVGKTGHKQHGTDILVRLPDQKPLSFQCKREAQFGPRKVSEAIRTHEIDASAKFLLLARVASPAARLEVAKHPDWHIWDQSDLSRTFRMLPPDTQCRLVDTFFPGQRFALLGLPPSPWQTNQAFFAPFLSGVPHRAFNHRWDLVGRAQELAALATALDDTSHPVVSLTGPVGGGKSRLLRAAVDDYQERRPSTAVFFLARNEALTTQAMAGLGSREKLLVVDDVHDRSDLPLLVDYVAEHSPNARALLTYRSYAAESVDRQLARCGLVANVTALARPTKTDALELAKQVLASLSGPLHAAELIADVAYDSPLSVVVAAWIVANEGMHPQLLGSHQVFRRTVITKYKEAIERLVAPNLRDQDALGRLLRVIALLQPINPDHRNFQDLSAHVADLHVTDVTRLSKALRQAGILFKHGRRYRLSPDALADAIIELDCVNADGTSNREAERVFNSASDEYKANLFINLGRLDWRRSEGDTSQSVLLEQFWLNLRPLGRFGDASIKEAAETAAMYQPRQAIAYAQRMRNTPSVDHGHLCRLLKHASYSLKHLPEACALLWTFARDDSRELNPHPEHPVRILEEMATPDPRKPIAYVTTLVHFILTLLDHAENWRHPYTPFDVLRGALATEGDFTSQVTSRKITRSAYGVNIERVRGIRQEIIAAALQSLTATIPRRAYAAAKLLEVAIRGPMGVMGWQPSDDELNEWSQEADQTLERIHAIVSEQHIEPVVLVRLAESLWFRRDSVNPRAKAAARQVIAMLERDLETRVTRCLVGTGVYEFAEDSPDTRPRHLEITARSLFQTFPDAEALVVFLEARFEAINAYESDLLARSGAFIETVLDASPDVVRLVLETYSRSEDNLWRNYAAAALARHLRHSREKAGAYITALLERGDDHLEIVSAAYVRVLDRLPTLSQDDANVLRRVFASSNHRLSQSAAWLFRHAAHHDRRLALDLILHANTALIGAMTPDLFMWLTSEPIPLSSLSEKDLAGLVSLLKAATSLDNYHVHHFLQHVSARHPELVVDLVKDRLDAASARDWTSGRFDPVRGPGSDQGPLNTHVHPDASHLLLELLDWALERLANPRLTHYLGDAVDALFRLESTTCVETLEKWCTQGTARHFTLLERILREAPPTFVFSQQAFVSRVLGAVRSHGTSLGAELEQSLTHSAIVGARSGIPGEPYPQDIRLRDQAAAALASLDSSDPACSLFNTLHDEATHRIGVAIEEGKAMDEEDAELV